MWTLQNIAITHGRWNLFDLMKLAKAFKPMHEAILRQINERSEAQNRCWLDDMFDDFSENFERQFGCSPSILRNDEPFSKSFESICDKLGYRDKIWCIFIICKHRTKYGTIK